MDRIQVKCVVMGDIKVGKTSLIMSYAYNMFQEEDIPLVFDFKTTITENDKPVDLVLWDTCGNADYNKLRPVSLPDTDVCLLCFSLDDPDSFTFVEEKVSNYRTGLPRHQTSLSKYINFACWY
ncbi:rho-related protein racA-like isoform X3 [Mytilus trossulus]|uniref:rho-related protein racA-like isoform X3 n=1 Tax=Mytilus trossulus TaxID=6551 RepID=UPI003003FF44